MVAVRPGAADAGTVPENLRERDRSACAKSPAAARWPNHVPEGAPRGEAGPVSFLFWAAAPDPRPRRAGRRFCGKSAGAPFAPTASSITAIFLQSRSSLGRRARGSLDESATRDRYALGRARGGRRRAGGRRSLAGQGLGGQRRQNGTAGGKTARDSPAGAALCPAPRCPGPKHPAGVPFARVGSQTRHVAQLTTPDQSIVGRREPAGERRGPSAPRHRSRQPNTEKAGDGPGPERMSDPRRRRGAGEGKKESRRSLVRARRTPSRSRTGAGREPPRLAASVVRGVVGQSDGRSTR